MCSSSSTASTDKLIRACSLLLLAALAACSSSPAFKAAPSQHPASAHIELRHFPQTPYQCGPAALATSLQYVNINVQPEDLTRSLYIPDKRGSFALELKARARQFGVMAYRPQPEINNLLAHLAEGTPVLVLQNLGLNWLPQWHFAVAVGFDLPRRKIILHSGETAYLETDIDLFARTWQRAENWALVITNPDNTPAAASAESWLDAATELEQTGKAEAALAAYHTATTRWPRSAGGWLGQGNVQYALGKYARARDSFLIYTELSPGDASGWNNLGYALLASGCTVGAAQSVQCAATLAPDDPRFADSAAEIGSAPAQAYPNCVTVPACPISPQTTFKGDEYRTE